jgi:hypothetical protein
MVNFINRMQETKKTDQVYRLDWNIDHIIDGAEVDGWLRDLNFPNAPDNSAFWRIKEDLNLPNRVEFDAIGDVFETIDYPYTDVRWPIMSQHMLDTLLSVGNFRHRAYPLRMIDCQVIGHNKQDNSSVISGIEYNNFFAVHVLEDLDIFDWENSVYERDSEVPDVIWETEKIVFNEPLTGFPPLFRVVKFETYLYVSAEARTALDAAGIRGVDFIQAENNYTLVGSLP